MPKGFSDADKNKWLELFEAGKTERRIAADDARCDLRTVRKGIEEARRNREGVVIRRELLKDAFRKHQDDLMAKLDRIMSAITLPPKDLTVLSWLTSEDLVLTGPPETVDQHAINAKMPLAIASEGALTGLLKEHLRNDTLWKAIAQFEKVYEAHLKARIALQRKVASILQDTTGYELTDQSGAPLPFLYSNAGGWLYSVAVGSAFAPVKSVDVERYIVANSEAGNVTYHGSILAEATGCEEQTKAALIRALHEVLCVPEVAPVADTYRTLQDAAAKARQTGDGIKLLNMIPGRCEVCRRLGI